MKHFLKLLDCTKEEITELLDLADRLKQYVKEGKEHHFLKGKTLGMIFEKSSTRTRVSFETGMYQLGGHALFISSRDSQIGRGEPTQDTARVLSRMLDGIMIRTFEQKEVEMLAEYGSIPVINGLTDFCHPCQVMADLQTIREHKGRLEGLLYRRWQQYGKFSDCGRAEGRYGCQHCHAGRLPPRAGGSGICQGLWCEIPPYGYADGGREGCGRRCNGRMDFHGAGGGEETA